MNQDFGVSLNPLVEFLVRDLCILDSDLVAHHKRWPSLARNDQVSQISVVLLDVALARGQRQSLEIKSESPSSTTSSISARYLLEQFAKAQADPTFGTGFIRRTGVRWDIKP